MSASASDLAIKPPTTLLKAIDELNGLRDEWQAYVKRDTFRWPNKATMEQVLVEYSYLLDQSSRFCRRVKFAASVLEQQKESLLQSTTLTDENRESAALAGECRALQLELEQKKSAALADENRALRLELEQEKKANAICKTQGKENVGSEKKARRCSARAEIYKEQFETAMTKLTQAEEIIEGVASWSSLMRRKSMDEQKSQLSRPTYGGIDYSPSYPEIVLRNKDYIWTESSLTPGDHSFIFSCGRPLEDIMLEHKVTKSGFRLYIINHMGHSVYYGVYTALSWPSKAMTGPEFLKLSEETRNAIVSRASGADPGTLQFNAVDEDFARSRRRVPCSVLQCLQPPLPSLMQSERSGLARPPQFQRHAPAPRPAIGQLYNPGSDAMQPHAQPARDSFVPPAPASTPVRELSPLSVPALHVANTSTNAAPAPYAPAPAPSAPAPAPAPLRPHGPLYNQCRYATTVGGRPGPRRNGQKNIVYETAKITSEHWAASGSVIPILPQPANERDSFARRSGW